MRNLSLSYVRWTATAGFEYIETNHLEDSKFPLHLNQIFFKWLVSELISGLGQSSRHFWWVIVWSSLKKLKKQTLNSFNYHACGFHIRMCNHCFIGVKIWKNKALNCSRWQNHLLLCPTGTNKAGPFSPPKSPALAKMTDLQLRRWPNSHNYIYIIFYSCTAVLCEVCKIFPYCSQREHGPAFMKPHR